MNNLKKNIIEGVNIKREEPFRRRSLNPYLDNKWIGNAIAYGCYRKGQFPGNGSPSDGELLEDLRIISKYWRLIRTYGTDKDTSRVLKLIAQHQIPLKVFQGVWISPLETNVSHKENNITQILQSIELANKYPEQIIALCVGNETQVSWSCNKVSKDLLVQYIRAVRNNVSLPVTTADDYLYWCEKESFDLSNEIDFICTHIHPLWNKQTLGSAISWIDKIYNSHKKLYPKHQIVIGETGWATDFISNTKSNNKQEILVKGEVSYQAQESFLDKIKQWVEANNVTTFLFEAFDESWKGGGNKTTSSDIEKNWGLFKEDRTPKKSAIKFLNDIKEK